VLRPGGSYILSTWGTWAENPFGELAHRVAAGFFPEDPPAFYRIPFSYHDPEEIARAMTAAGFAEVSVERLSLTSAIPDPGLFARGIVFGNPLYDEILKRGGDPQTVCAAIERAVAETLCHEMPLLALVAQGRKPPAAARP
jgi:hypothetical protein